MTSLVPMPIDLAICFVEYIFFSFHQSEKGSDCLVVACFVHRHKLAKFVLLGYVNESVI